MSGVQVIMMEVGSTREGFLMYTNRGDFQLTLDPSRAVTFLSQREAIKAVQIFRKSTSGIWRSNISSGKFSSTPPRTRPTAWAVLLGDFLP